MQEHHITSIVKKNTTENISSKNVNCFSTKQTLHVKNITLRIAYNRLLYEFRTWERAFIFFVLNFILFLKLYVFFLFVFNRYMQNILFFYSDLHTETIQQCKHWRCAFGVARKSINNRTNLYRFYKCEKSLLNWIIVLYERYKFRYFITL